MTLTTTAAAALAPSLFQRHPPSLHPSLPPIVSAPLVIRAARPRPAAARRAVSCQVALTTDVSSSAESPDVAEEESKVGARVRVTAPLKVYHVPKIPEVELRGMEGTIKQFVGVWKGKRISANFPFKVEFFLPVDGQDKPVKFVAHLKEDEFEYISG